MTIANLQAAVAGDAAQLAWFTDTFFSGPAAGAAFASGGEFSVVEFTDATIIGANAAFGSWMITDFTATLPMGPNNAKAQIEETAKINLGPFDVVIQLDQTGDFIVEKTVLNNTGLPWTQFRIELGTGSGAGFVPATGSLRFLGPISETTGAFPEVDSEPNLLVFKGLLPPGDTARFVFGVNAPFGTNFVTLRQRAIAGLAAVPAVSAEALLALVVVLGGAAALSLRRRSNRIH